MVPPRHYSVSPLYSFVTVPTPVYRVSPFPQMLSQVIRWLTGRGPVSSQRDAFLERRAIDLLAEELEEAEPIASTAQATQSERQPT